jgi:CubicO group peptidase (beta-lactamase class C family)
LLTVLALTVCPAVAFADDPQSKAIDAAVKQVMTRWKVPGVAVVIVRDDEVTYLKGHGVRETGKTDLVTPDTAFALASLTKAFTATALGVLVDEGKAGFDDKVSKHLPGFRLSDPLADRDVTLRDLLCHRSGLARHDWLWYRAPWSLTETVKRVAFLEPAHPFRGRYDYCNLGYVAAGLAMGEAANSSWEQLTRKKLLEPLGMKDAAFTRKAVLALKDHATPHRIVGGEAKAIEWYPGDEQVRASGSLKASAREMANWLRMNLNGGAVGGKRIVSAKSLAEVHAPHVVVPLEADVAEMAGATQRSYGLGWHVLDYRGAPVLTHGGAADGLRAMIGLLPKKKAGFVLFCNLEMNEGVFALGNLLLDALLGVEPKDWVGFYLKKQEARLATVAQARKTMLASRKRDTKPSHDWPAYAGTYEDKAYGRATVKASDNGLSLAWSGFTAELSHFHYDTFLVKSSQERLDGGLARFELDRDGNVKTLHWLERTFTRKE